MNLAGSVAISGEEYSPWFFSRLGTAVRLNSSLWKVKEGDLGHFQVSPRREGTSLLFLLSVLLAEMSTRWLGAPLDAAVERRVEQSHPKDLYIFIKIFVLDSGLSLNFCVVQQ